MKVAIAGKGFVGNATYQMFKSLYSVISLFDENTQCLDDEFDIMFICVPTDNKNGETDLENVESVFKRFKSKLFVLKSTVPIGTTDFLSNKYNVNLIYFPEFLSESKYPNPTNFDGKIENFPYFVLGGNKDLCKQFLTPLQKVSGPYKKYFITTSSTAELLKYTVNNFMSYKNYYFNFIENLCSKVNVDYNELRNMFLNDPRIEPIHTLVIEGKRGFSGKCLPKDLESFISQLDKLNVRSNVFKEIFQENNVFKNK